MACQHYFETKTIHGKPVKVPCGKCLPCMRQKRSFWSHRIQSDVQAAYPAGSSFLTLTIEGDSPALSKKDLSEFFRSLRRSLGFTPKHFALGDYGSRTKRAHYHAIVIGLDPSQKSLVARCWPHGFVDVAVATPGRINYILSYLEKLAPAYRREFEEAGLQPPFTSISRGIGRSLFDKYPDGRYWINGRWYTVPWYWRAQLGLPKHNPSTQDLNARISEARKNGMSVPSYEALRHHQSEVSQLRNSQNRLKPPQGVRHLPNDEPIPVYKGHGLDIPDDIF